MEKTGVPLPAEAGGWEGLEGLTHPLAACASRRRPRVNGLTSLRQSARWASDAFLIW